MNHDEYKAKLTAYTKVNEATGCWEWQAAKLPSGYGQAIFEGRHYRAHRMAYELWVGPIPEGMHVCHKCDNPPCCNPEHLFIGTAFDNMRDAASKGRLARGVSPGKRVARKRILDEEAVRVIRESPPSVRHAELAERFGVCYMTIWKVRHGLQKIHSPIPEGGLLKKRKYFKIKDHQI